MPKFTKCAYIGCNSNAFDNKGFSFFRFPITYPKRCEKWVKAANNPQIMSLYTEKSQILGYRALCELHFDKKDITQYNQRKRLDSNAVPFINQTFNNTNTSNTTNTNTNTVNKTHKPLKTGKKSAKAAKTRQNANELPTNTIKQSNNSLEIIEINGNRSSYLNNRRKKSNHSSSNLEIIEIEARIEDNRTTNNGFLLGHELIKLKKEFNKWK